MWRQTIYRKDTGGGISGEVERDWALELGRERFAQLRALLLDLNGII